MTTVADLLLADAEHVASCSKVACEHEFVESLREFAACSPDAVAEQLILIAVAKLLPPLIAVAAATKPDRHHMPIKA